MLHNCNVFEHIIVIYRFVIRKTWPLPCVLSFFWSLLEWPTYIAGAAVQVLWQLWVWPAPSLRRRCFGVSGELVVQLGGSGGRGFHGNSILYPWDGRITRMGSPSYDPSGESRLAFFLDPLELASHLFGSKTIGEGLVRFRFCQVRKTSVGARSNRRSTLVMTDQTASRELLVLGTPKTTGWWLMGKVWEIMEHQEVFEVHLAVFDISKSYGRIVSMQTVPLQEFRGGQHWVSVVGCRSWSYFYIIFMGFQLRSQAPQSRVSQVWQG